MLETLPSRPPRFSRIQACGWKEGFEVVSFCGYSRTNPHWRNELRETYPLQWPSGQPRTPIKDREVRKAWKKTERQAADQLETELKRFGVLASTITRKDPSDIRTAPDPSIALYFSRPKDEDFNWQHALGITNPAPTVEEIEQAFRRLAAQHHPDRGGDIEIFRALSEHKKNALSFVNRMSGAAHDYAIACDKFTEARWNIAAIAHTIHSFRQMERDGTSRILEQAMEGFRPALKEGINVAASA